MLGAILGDIIGSRFEFDNRRTKDFTLFHEECFFTDDSVMTLAVADALLACEAGLAARSRSAGSGADSGLDPATDSLADPWADLPTQAVRSLRAIGQQYPNCGYGGMFARWMFSPDPKPYHSFGNGAAMRVSPCGFAARSLEEAKRLSHAVTAVTHDHPEGLKGAEATAVCIYLARTGATLADLRAHVVAHYYPFDFTLDGIRPSYQFNETCQETVPQAIQCVLESTSFEDAIRNAISIGGDSDTLGAIAGGIAQAFYGVPEAMRKAGMRYLDKDLRTVLERFEERFDRRRVDARLQ